jgi:hypothetical protein
VTTSSTVCAGAEKPQQLGINRAVGGAALHAAAGEAGELVEAREIVIDRWRFAEPPAQGIADRLRGFRIGHVHSRVQSVRHSLAF